MLLLNTWQDLPALDGLKINVLHMPEGDLVILASKPINFARQAVVSLRFTTKEKVLPPYDDLS